MDNKVCIIKGNNMGYPDKLDLFRPSTKYPEYIFKDDFSLNKNHVYDMIREGLHMYGFDRENYGTNHWNPLKNIVRPGEKVLIKPNLVIHENLAGLGEDCLYTHPSIIAAIIDYVLIAQEGQGEIIVGDAPLQECVFDTLIENSGYQKLLNYYLNKGINISLKDFRNTRTYVKDNIHYLQSDDECNNGLIVKLNEESMFVAKSEQEIKKLRITNYDPRILQKHHSTNKHEYMISKDVLSADVIINVPKPKTHRKAGITASLKNLVGINANKEYLPHHMLGSSEEGGDAYKKKNEYLSRANDFLDKKNEFNFENKVDSAKKMEQLYLESYLKGITECHEQYWEGSWYGNDTIWRTIVDLNRILLFADKKGRMTDSKQRKYFIIGDMVVSGDKEGPLLPSPVITDIILFGEDPVSFDRTVCSIMGFDYHDIKLLANDDIYSGKYGFNRYDDVEIVSNKQEWNNNCLSIIKDKYSFDFEPTAGWRFKLGSPKLKRIVMQMNTNKKICIFGACTDGVNIAEFLINNNFTIECFCDNNTDKQKSNFWNNIKCISPQELDNTYSCLIAVPQKYRLQIEGQLKELKVEEFYSVTYE